jgi:hypothetical protein
MFCSKCGKENEEDINFCSFCGYKINKQMSTGVFQNLKGLIKYTLQKESGVNKSKIEFPKAIIIGLILLCVFFVSSLSFCFFRIIVLEKRLSKFTNNLQTEMISTKQFNLMDQNGKVRAWMVVDKKTIRFEMLSSHGKPIVQILGHNESTDSNMNILRFGNDKNNSEMTVINTNFGSSLLFTDQKNLVKIAISCINGKPKIEVYK